MKSKLVTCALLLACVLMFAAAAHCQDKTEIVIENGVKKLHTSYPPDASFGVGGSGDVSKTGTPLAGQIAVWTDSSHAKGQDKAAIDFRDYGTDDEVDLLHCSISSSSAVLTCTDAAFTSADVGKTISVFGAMTGAYQLTTTIASRTSGTVVHLTATAGAAVSDKPAYYGTDNFAAMASWLSACGGKNCIQPSGHNYLVKSNGIAWSDALLITSNTTVVGGAKIQWVGITGEPGTTGQGAQSGTALFDVPDGSINVDISKLWIKGENFPFNYTNSYENQTAAILLVGSPTPATYVKIHNNRLENLYGFSIHNPANGYAIDIIDNTFIDIVNGLNVNSEKTKQSGNTFSYAGGLEVGGLGGATIANNVLDHSWGGISAGGGDNYTISNNTITNPEREGMSIPDCHGCTISGNTITGLGAYDGVTVSGTSANVTLIGNAVTGPTVGYCSIGFFIGGVSGIKLIGNSSTGCSQAAQIGVNGAELIGNTWTTSNPGYDLAINAVTNVLVKGDKLTGSYLNLSGGGTLATGSFFAGTSGPYSGTLFAGGVFTDANGPISVGKAGQYNAPTLYGPENTTGFWFPGAGKMGGVHGGNPFELYDSKGLAELYNNGMFGFAQLSDGSWLAGLSYGGTTGSFLFGNGTMGDYSGSIKTGTLIQSAGTSTNHGVCFKSTGALGYCSTVLAADGTCTCN